MDKYQHFPKVRSEVTRVLPWTISPPKPKLFWSIETQDNGKLRKKEGECRSLLRNLAAIIEPFLCARSSHTYPCYYFLTDNPDRFNPHFGKHVYEYSDYWSHYPQYGNTANSSANCFTDTSRIGYGVSDGDPSFGDGDFTFADSGVSNAIVVTDTSSELTYNLQTTFTPSTSCTARQLALVGKINYVATNDAHPEWVPYGGSVYLTFIKDHIPDFSVQAGVPVTIKFTLTWSSADICYTRNFGLLVMGLLQGFNVNLTGTEGEFSLPLQFRVHIEDSLCTPLIAFLVLSSNSGGTPDLKASYIDHSIAGNLSNGLSVVTFDDSATKMSWYTSEVLTSLQSSTVREVGWYVGFMSGSNLRNVLMLRGLVTPFDIGIGDTVNVRFLHEIAL